VAYILTAIRAPVLLFVVFCMTLMKTEFLQSIRFLSEASGKESYVGKNNWMPPNNELLFSTCIPLVSAFFRCQIE